MTECVFLGSDKNPKTYVAARLFKASFYVFIFSVFYILCLQLKSSPLHCNLDITIFVFGSYLQMGKMGTSDSTVVLYELIP